MIKSLCCASFSFKLNISAQVGKDSSLTIQAEQKFWDSIKKIKWENLIVLKAESAISSSKSASLFKTMSRRFFFSTQLEPQSWQTMKRQLAGSASGRVRTSRFSLGPNTAEVQTRRN